MRMGKGAEVPPQPPVPPHCTVASAGAAGYAPHRERTRMTTARDRFAALAALDDAAIDVPTGALVIAQEAYAALDIDLYLARLDDLAAAARPHVPASLAVAERMARLTRFLYVEQGFTGNDRSYYDPRNSFLNEVLDRRTGIPITLSIVYCAVGQRLGLSLGGVGFPGHFLVKHLGDPEIIADPFFGKLVTVEECAARLREVYGPNARFDHAYLRPASPRDILVRMLSNLKRVYVENGDVMRTLSCIDRILLLTPEAVQELRDRGLLYRKLECFGPALRDLEHYLRLAPQGEGADAVRAILPALQRDAAHVQ